MKRTEAETIGQIIDHYMKAQNLDHQLDEQRASALWPEIMGQGINRYTISRSVKNGIMTVRLSSAILRNELMLNRSRIITQLNEALGREVVKEIIFK